MKPNLKFIIPLSMLVIFTISACEIPRPGGDVGDISIPTPDVAEPGGETEPPPPPPPPPDTPEEAIDPEGVPAAVAPTGVDAVEPGKVLLKLNPQAAIQAFGAELGSDNIVQAGIPSLDERLRDIGASELEPVIEEVSGAVGQDIQSFAVETGPVSQLYSATFPPERDPNEVAVLLAEDPTVEYAEPNYIAGIAGEPQYIPMQLDPNDQFFPFQWHMRAIQMPLAWELSRGQGVLVAVLDTGIDFNAPDLMNTNRRTGHDFVNNDNDATDDHSHGTHVAGTIAQSTNNGQGVTGVAFEAELLPVKTLRANGTGTYENIIKGIAYAVDQGAKVINLSLAGQNASQALREAVQLAHSRGVLVVAAAGNSNSAVQYPGAYDEFVLTVGATDFGGNRARYSNFGPAIDLVAPGGDITKDENNDQFGDGVLQMSFKTPGNYTYLFFEGTSMASPHVAGVAALLFSLRPDASPNEIESYMVQTAQNRGSPEEYGAGLIQAAAALGSVAPVPPPPSPTFTAEPPTTVPVPPPTDTPTPTEPIDEHEPDLPSATPTPTLEPVTPTATSATPGVAEPPTDTPTPTPFIPLPEGELLLNGDFENDEGWIFGDTPVRGEYDSAAAFSGSRAARIGITSDQDAYSFTSVWQQVTIPPEANQVVLTAHVYPITQEGPGGDTQNILILNNRFRTIRTLSKELSNSQTWETRTYDLSDLRGQTIYVYFGVFNRGFTGRPTGMYVDNVSLNWSQ